MEKKAKIFVTLVTGRTIGQGVGKESGKSTATYMENVAICRIDAEDLEKLRVRENTNVLVSTKQGSVVLKAVKSPRGSHLGIAFVPYGPWANVVVETETDSTGMPTFKGTPATIEPAYDKSVSSLKELLKQEFGK
ncbi:MAG: molybdopterin dinucleotide binding domain-containing protein [Candidatus Bathyarchaeia archaeon]